MLADVVGSYPAGSSTVQAFVAITFSAAQRSGSKKRKPEQVGRELERPLWDRLRDFVRRLGLSD